MNWYCIHTRPLKETQTASYFHRMLGLETYFPRLVQQKTIRRIRRTVKSALFPRYLFCRFDLSDSYRAVRYAPEVIDVVRFGEGPAKVSDALIEQLKGWAGEALDLITIRPDLEPGQRVEITDGPMRGLPGVIVQVRNDSDRVAILLSILECGAKLIVSRSQIARIA